MKSAACLIVALLIISICCLSIGNCSAEYRTTNSLQATLNTSCIIPFQTVSPIAVSFTITNIGNETFNGIVRLKASSDSGHVWTEMTYAVSNLTTNDVYENSTSYNSIDAGLYYFTLVVESNDTLGNVKLYQDYNGTNLLKEGGYVVDTGTTIFLHSFTEFLTIVGIVVGAIVAIAVAVYAKKKKH